MTEAEQKQPEFECVKCGKHATDRQSKGYMLGGKFYCWTCAGNELAMDERMKKRNEYKRII